MRQKEKIAPNIKIMATVALAALAFCVSLNKPLAVVMPTQTTAQPAIPVIIRRRLPTLSTKADPISAKTNWKHEYPKLMLVCWIAVWYPAVSSTAPMK